MRLYKKHLIYIIIGLVAGTLPACLIWLIRTASLDLDTVLVAMLIGGVPGAILGWVGGTLVTKNNLGAVVGGLLGSSYMALVFASMQ